MDDNTSPKNMDLLNQQNFHMRKEQNYNQFVWYLPRFLDKQNASAKG